MIKLKDLRADYRILDGDFSGRIISSVCPVFSWGAITDCNDDFQRAYIVKVYCGGNLLWNSGIVYSDKPYAKYNGTSMPVGERIDFFVSVAGSDGIFSAEESEYFYIGTFSQMPPAKWIYSSVDTESVPAYFEKKFEEAESVISATAFISGMGYFKAYINNNEIDTSFLNPAVSDYTKTCYYCTIPHIEKFINTGSNSIKIILADGWRRNNGEYLKIYNNTPDFFGTPCIWAAIRLTFSDGSESWIYSDQTWHCGTGPITFSHLFNGETYDAAAKEIIDKPVLIYNGEAGALKPMTIPSINVSATYSPKSINCIHGKYIIDFGTNMSGILKIKLPETMEKGHKIVIRHAQLLYDDGNINTENLRGALCRDTYIASGNDGLYWQPIFTYHGFRYAEISGIPILQKEDAEAIMICTSLKETSYFQSGSPMLNAIHDITLQTGKSVMHGAFNDTCGRSERMNWYGTECYNEFSYNFEIGRILPHMMKLIRDTQGGDGSLTCTAPHIYGRRPATAKASTYLLMADLLYKIIGNEEILAEHYDSLCAWEKCLLEHSDGYIVNYEHYGDWAGPEYSRDKNTKGGGAGSATIPPIMVSTAIAMNNAKMLKSFAEILGKTADAVYYMDLFKKIKNAFLDKWFDKSTCKVYNGSQSCQAIALWLGILDETESKKAARIMRDDLVNSNYRFTTGAFCSNHLCKALLDYGYIDEFYELITRDEYPSFGYMLQCGATTCWEKFEYLTGNNMNAHIHPDNTSIAQFFYSSLCGIVPVGVGSSEFDINPKYPTKLLTASLVYTTPRGDISVNWRRVDGYTSLSVNVPFNTKANIYTPDGVKTIGSGFYNFKF